MLKPLHDYVVLEKVKEEVATEEMPNYEEIYQKAIDNLYD